MPEESSVTQNNNNNNKARPTSYAGGLTVDGPPHTLAAWATPRESEAVGGAAAGGGGGGPTPNPHALSSTAIPPVFTMTTHVSNFQSGSFESGKQSPPPPQAPSSAGAAATAASSSGSPVGIAAATTPTFGLRSPHFRGSPPPGRRGVTSDEDEPTAQQQRTASSSPKHNSPPPPHRPHDDEDLSEDSLDDEQDRLSAAGGGGGGGPSSATSRSVISGLDDRSHMSMGGVLNRIFLAFLISLCLVLLGLCVYVNVTFAWSKEEAIALAENCPLNGSSASSSIASSSSNNWTEDELQFLRYSDVMFQLYLGSVSMALGTVAMSSHGFCASRTFLAVEQAASALRSASPQPNSLLSVAASYVLQLPDRMFLAAEIETWFLGRGSRRSAVVLAMFQFPPSDAGFANFSNSSDDAFVAVWSTLPTCSCMTTTLACGHISVFTRQTSVSAHYVVSRGQSGNARLMASSYALPRPLEVDDLLNLTLTASTGMSLATVTSTGKLAVVTARTIDNIATTVVTLSSPDLIGALLEGSRLPQCTGTGMDEAESAIVSSVAQQRLAGTHSVIRQWPLDGSGGRLVVGAAATDSDWLRQSNTSTYRVLDGTVRVTSTGAAARDLVVLSQPLSCTVIISGTSVTVNTTTLQVVAYADRGAVEYQRQALRREVQQKATDAQIGLAVVTAIVGLLALLFTVWYWFRLVGVTSTITADIRAMLECLLYARSMELEKAVIFGSKPETANGGKDSGHGSKPASEPQSPSSARQRSLRRFGSTSPSAADLSVSPLLQAAAPHATYHPFSVVREVYQAQECINAMMVALRDYRKFLPSTLFVHGEVPLQEELAEELLQQPLEGPHSPAASVIGGQQQPQHSQLIPSGSANITANTTTVVVPPAKSPLHAITTSGVFGSPRNATLAVTDSNGVLEAQKSGEFDKTQRSNTSRSSSPALLKLNKPAGGSTADPLQLSGQMDRQHASALDLGLKRRRATILTVTFVGFLRLSQESVSDAHSVSQTFLQIVLSVVDRNGGVVLVLLPDKVVVTWNCFRTDQYHEWRGAACAHELSSTLQAADEEFLFSEHQLAIVVTTGSVAAGTSGTSTERASVVEGRCIELANDLLSLMVALNVRCAITEGIADHLQEPLWSMPIDNVTDEDGENHLIHELRHGEEPPYMEEYRKGFTAFVDRNYATAKEHFSETVKQSVPRVDTHAMRLLKLSLMFSKLQTPYIRLVPQWQRFESDAPRDAYSPDASPKRRYKSERRVSHMADEQLRAELMQMRSAEGNSAMRNKGFLTDGMDHSQRLSPRSPETRGTWLESPAPGERRSSTERRGSNLGMGAAGRRRSTPRASVLEAQIALARDLLAPTNSPGSTSMTPRPANAIEFRDKRDMVFRLSDHVLGRGAVGEVLMGMSESGGLVAIKTVPLPAFAKQEEAPMNEMQRRRLKRKGISVATNLDADVDGLLNEVALLSRLRHENIVGYLSSAIVNKKIVVVMEYISGGSLLNLVKEFGGVPVMTAKRYLRDILRGLQYLHQEDIVHRDIKPQNVLLLIDGSCKLTDFGTGQRLSKLAGVASMEGTPQYMSPEATLGKAEKASDIWSFGILMAQLLTGELPWPREEGFLAVRFTYRLGHDETMVPVLADSIPTDAKEIIQWCCQREASKRPTAAALLQHSFFQLAFLGNTPMKARGSSRSKRVERSMTRSPSYAGTAMGAASPVTTTGASASRRPINLAASSLMKFSAFAESKTPSPPSDPFHGEELIIPGLVVHAPEEDEAPMSAAFDSELLDAQESGPEQPAEL